MPDLSIGYDSSKAAAGMAVWLREAKRGGDAARQLEAETKKAGVAAGGAGRQLKDAGDKAQRMVRQQELVARVMRETGASAATAGKAVRVFGADMDRAEKEAVGLARQLDVAEKEIRQLAHAQRTASGTGLTAALKRQAVGLAGIAAGAVGAQAALREFKEGFQDALDFESDLKKLTTLVGVQSDVVAGWRDQIIGVSRVTGTLTDELGPALFQITSGGERGASAMKLLEDAAKASAIGLGDAADIGKIATAAYQAYGAAAFEAVSPTDILGATIREGALDTASLAGVMGQAIPLANQLGITFADLGGFVATFSRLGINAEESITAVRGAMAFLIKPTKEGQKALAEVGLSLEELRRIAREDGLAAVLLKLTAAFKGNEEGIAKVIPNIRALTGVLGTAGAFGEKYAEISKSIADATGFIDDAFEELGDDPAQQARLITAEYEALRLELSTQFLPVLTTVLESLRQVTDNDDAIDLFHRLGQAVKIATAIASLWITEQARVRDGMNELAESIGRLLHPWATLEAEMEQERKDLEASRAAREAWQQALESATDGTREFQAALDAVVPPPFDEIATKADGAAKAIHTLADELREQLKVMTSTGTSSERAARALDLMRQGAAKTIPEAIALTHEIDALAVAIDRMNAANTTARRIAADTGGIVPLPGAAPRGGTSTLPLLEEAVPQQIQHLEAAGDSMREGASETAEATSRMLGQLATFFEKVGGNFGQMAAQLFRLVDIILNAVQAAQQAAAATSSTASKAGGAASGLSSASGFLAVMVAMYELFNAYAEASKGRRFSYEADIAYGQAAGYTGDAAFRDPRVRQSGPDTRQLWNSLRDALDQFRIAMGGILEWMPGLQIQIREDGKSVQAIVGGVIVGVFDTVEQAIREGLSRAIAGADWGDIGDNVARALKALGGFGNVDVEMVAKLLPRLQELDLVAGGATVSLAKAIIQWRSFFTGLDVESEHLLDLGVPLAEVLAMRKREIELIVADAEARGRSLAGIQDFAGPLQAWMDSLAGLDVALEDEADRTAGLTDVANDQSAAAAAATAANDGLRSSTDLATGSTVAHRDAIDGTRGPLDDSAAAAHGVSEAFREAVREIVSLQAQGSILGDLLSFQEKYGVQIADNEQLRQRIAELEFRSFQIRFQLAVAELVANQALLGLTNAQVNQWQRWAAEVAGLTFTGVAPGGGGGSRRQARQTAAEDWDEALRIMDRRLAGATPQMLALSDAADRLREMGEAAGKTTEEIAAALHDLAELQIADIVTDWAEAIQQSGETDTQTGLRHLADRAIDDLAAAAEAAAGDPELFAGAAETITGGFAALFQGDIQDQIDQLVASGDREGLQALFDQVSTFLDGDFPPEMQGVIDMLRQWLEGAVAAGETTIALSDESAAATERDAAAEAAYRQAAEQSAQAERDLAAARDQARDALTTLVDEGLSPSLAAYRQQMRALDELVQSSLDAAESEEERAFIMDQANKSMTRSQAQFVQGLLGEINALGIDLRAAGIDTRAFAMAMLELKRAEVLAALGTEGFAAAAEKWGLDVPAIVATVTGATLELDEAAQSVARSTRTVTEAARHFVLGVGLVEENAEDAGRSLAEIIDDLLYDAMSPGEQLFADWQRLREEIMAAAGTDAERIRALELAEEQYQRARLADLRDLYEELTGRQVTSQSPRRAFAAGQAAFEAAVAGGDPEAIAEAARLFLEAAQGIGSFERAAEAQVLAALQSMGLGAGGGAPAPLAFNGAPPLGLGPSPLVAPAPSVTLNTSGIEQRLGAIEQHLLALSGPIGVTAAQTTLTAQRVRPLDDLGAYLQRQ